MPLSKKRQPRQSQLDRIFQSLSRNPAIECWQPIFNNDHDILLETAIIIVAPKQLTTSAEDLNALMRQLTPGASFRQRFSDGSSSAAQKVEFTGNVLSLGSAWYDEPVMVKITKTIEVIKRKGAVELALHDKTFVKGAKTSVENKSLSYRTEVRVFPHPCFARAFLNTGDFHSRIEREDLVCRCATARKHSKAKAA